MERRTDRREKRWEGRGMERRTDRREKRWE